MKKGTAFRKLLWLMCGTTVVCSSLTACGETNTGAGISAEIQTDREGNGTQEKREVSLYVQEAFCGTWYVAQEQYEESGADEIVLQLIADGSSLVRDGQFNMDVLAEKPVITELSDGGFRAEFTLKDNLKWSDGSSVTAEDYVLALALFSQGDVCDALAGYCDVMSGSCFAGWEDYHRSTWAEAVSASTGHIEPFAGVHLTGEYSFVCEVVSLGEVKPEKVLDLVPLPIHVWLPDNVQILDDGEGVFLSSAARADYVSEYIKCQNLNVSAGEYYVESYDSEKGQVMLAKNSYYAGTSVMPDGISYDKVCLMYDAEQDDKVAVQQELSEALWKVYGREKLNNQPGLCLVLPEGWENDGAYEALAGIIDYEVLRGCYEAAGWRIAEPTGDNESDAESEDGETEENDSSGENSTEPDGTEPGRNSDMTPEEIGLLLAEYGWNMNSQGGTYEMKDGVRYREGEGGPVPCSVTVCVPYEAKDAAKNLLSGYTAEELLLAAGMRVEVVCVDADTWKLLWDENHIGVGVSEGYVSGLESNPLKLWLSTDCCQR